MIVKTSTIETQFMMLHTMTKMDSELEGLKCALEEDMAQCVMMDGIIMMLLLSADS